MRRQQQDEILELLSDGRTRTLGEIASVFEVSYKTAQRRVAELAATYPIETFCGGTNFGGGVRMYHAAKKHYFATDELQTIVEALKLLQATGRSVESLITKATPTHKKGGKAF